MTRSRSIAVVKPPCCSQLYKEVLYSTVNYSATEYWTDGYVKYRLAPSEDGLCHCTCGQYFYSRKCQQLYQVQNGESREGLDAMDLLPWVRDSELEAFVNSDCADTQLQIIGRRRYWRLLNNSFRAHYRECRERSKPEEIRFNPTEEQLTNMRALLELLLVELKPDWFEVAELHHQLGNNEQALDCLNRVGDNAAKLVAEKRQYIAEGMTGPFRYGSALVPELVLSPNALAWKAAHDRYWEQRQRPLSVRLREWVGGQLRKISR